MKETNEGNYPQGDNQKLIIGLVLGILTGLIIAFYFLDYFTLFSHFLLNILLSLFVFTAILIFVYFWFKDRILSHLFGKELEVEDKKGELKNLYDTIGVQFTGKLLENFPEETQSKAKRYFPRILKLGVWAVTRNWALRIITTIFIAIGGLLGSILLYNQNQLIVKQNDRIDIQNSLLEADRRSSLVFLMSNILDKVDSEIKSQRDTMQNEVTESSEIKYSLSKPLMSRIIALSRALRPYRIMDGDTLSTELISPERGQLFIALMENGLDSRTQYEIVNKGNFSYADIGRTRIYNASFPNANLSHVNLNSTSFMWGGDLLGVNFSGAKLLFVNFSGADIGNVDFSGADLTKANFGGVKLGGVNFANAKLYHANFRKADFSGVKNINFNQLKNVKSLFDAKNIDPDLLLILKEKKPCLFTEKGCSE